jgi:hypothetical protein
MKSEYLIGCHGCDDSTTITMELEDSEYEVISRLCNLITEESSYGCMPTMSIDKVELFNDYL